MDINSIDWTDGTQKISNHFTVKEALWLPTWGRLANESDGLTDDIKTSLLNTVAWMDKIRDFFNAPINVHVAERPPAYNQLIGGAASSMHMFGRAVDFDVSGLECKDAISQILSNNLLTSMGLRMENNGPAPSWVHLDDKELTPGHNAYFIP